MVTITEEILKGKLDFLCSVIIDWNLNEHMHMPRHFFVNYFIKDVVAYWQFLATFGILFQKWLPRDVLCKSFSETFRRKVECQSLKRDPNTLFSPLNFVKCFRTTFIKNICETLLLFFFFIKNIMECKDQKYRFGIKL